MSNILSLWPHIHDGTEQVADDRAENQQDNGDNNCDQNKNQPIFKKTLPLFALAKRASFSLFPFTTTANKRTTNIQAQYTPDVAFCHVLELHTNVPLRRSFSACWISVAVFMTNGP